MQYMTLEIKIIFDKSCPLEVSPYKYVLHTHSVSWSEILETHSIQYHIKS